MADQPLPSTGALRQALAAPSIEQVLSVQMGARLVLPGIRALAWSEGLKVGDNTDLRDGHFLATVLGYLTVEEGRISVVPAVWIGPDRMDAHFVFLAQETPVGPLQPGWLFEALWQAGVRHGIQGAAIETLCREVLPRSSSTSFLLARGDLPINGADGYLQRYFSTERREVQILEDGTLDFSQQHLHQLVFAGQVLAELTPGGGQSGTDVTGVQVPAAAGGPQAAFPLKAGQNVRALSRGTQLSLLFSEVTGHLFLSDDMVSVKLVHQLPEVDAQTGPVDVDMDVRVTGSVQSGSTIKAGGSITVEGHVGSKVSLQAQGDIIVAKGISGEDTSIFCRGSLQTKFLQNCAVIARGDILVGSYVLNSKVRCGGGVVVRPGGGERGGSIIGGEVYAARGIEVRRLGAPSAVATVAGIAYDPEVTARLTKFRQTLEVYDANILRILRTLGLKNVDVTRIKLMVGQATSAKRVYLVENVKKLTELVQLKDKLFNAQESLKKQAGISSEGARITVGGTAYAGVQIRIDNFVYRLDQQIEQPSFFKGAEAVLYQVPDNGSADGGNPKSKGKT